MGGTCLWEEGGRSMFMLKRWEKKVIGKEMGGACSWDEGERRLGWRMGWR